MDTFLTYQRQTAFENIVGKREIARSEQFLLFPQYFVLSLITLSRFVQIFDIISLFAAEFEEPKIGISGKELSPFLTERGLTISRTTNFRLFQIVRACKRRFQIVMKIAEISHKRVENTVGERRNCSL